MRKIAKYQGLYEVKAEFNFNAYYGYFSLETMPDVYNFEKSLGRNVQFPDGFLWIFGIVSWAENSEAQMQRVVERLNDLQFSNGDEPLPSRTKLINDMGVQWTPIFSVGL